MNHQGKPLASVSCIKKNNPFFLVKYILLLNTNIHNVYEKVTMFKEQKNLALKKLPNEMISVSLKRFLFLLRNYNTILQNTYDLFFKKNG